MSKLMIVIATLLSITAVAGYAERENATATRIALPADERADYWSSGIVYSGRDETQVTPGSVSLQRGNFMLGIGGVGLVLWAVLYFRINSPDRKVVNTDGQLAEGLIIDACKSLLIECREARAGSCITQSSVPKATLALQQAELLPRQSKLMSLLVRACREGIDECTRFRTLGHMPGKTFVAWLDDVIFVAEGNDPSLRWPTRPEPRL